MPRSPAVTDPSEPLPSNPDTARTVKMTYLEFRFGSGDVADFALKDGRDTYKETSTHYIIKNGKTGQRVRLSKKWIAGVSDLEREIVEPAPQPPQPSQDTPSREG